MLDVLIMISIEIETADYEGEGLRLYPIPSNLNHLDDSLGVSENMLELELFRALIFVETP